MKIIAAFLLAALFVGSAQGATNQPPRYRLQRIEEWENFRPLGNLLLNNHHQLAALVDGEDGLHFFIRGRNRTADIRLPAESSFGSESLWDFNAYGMTMFWQGNHAAYRYWRGKFVNLASFLPYKYFNPAAINNHGHIAGGAQRDESSPITAYTYYRGHHRVLTPLLPGKHALAFAINNHGVAVGGAQHQTNEIDLITHGYHAVIFKKGKAHDIGVLEGAFASMATGINDRGTVIGDCEFTQSTEEGQIYYQRGFVYRDGIMSPLLPLPGEDDSRPESINKKGWIVGHSGNAAALFLNGQTFNLNDLLPPDTYPRLSRATAINDRGVIAAKNEYGEVFLLFPE